MGHVTMSCLTHCSVDISPTKRRANLNMNAIETDRVSLRSTTRYVDDATAPSAARDLRGRTFFRPLPAFAVEATYTPSNWLAEAWTVRKYLMILAQSVTSTTTELTFA